MKVVIMAGGRGNRFWPKSVEAKPKQFQPLTSEQTMLQESYRRFSRHIRPEDIYVVTAQKYVSLVTEQLPELQPSRLIVEPEQRDTAPCVALAALHFTNHGMDEPFVIVPSDHYIADEAAFLKAIAEAVELAREDGVIVTLGVAPTRPETGYGYIQTVPPGTPEAKALRVARFLEKPDAERAGKLMRTPGVFWNSGIFAWKPATVLYYLQRFEPEMWRLIDGHRDDIETVYARLPKKSVDYAILEKAENIYCVPVSFGWDDVGAWTAMERILPADGNRNVIRGKVVAARSKDNIILSECQETMVIGVEGLIIVSTADGLLVCAKSEEQEVKTLFQELQELMDATDPDKEGGA